jgi:hypothetical protein
MRPSRPERYVRLLALSLAVLVLAVLFLISGVFQWSALNCWHEDVDIKSGRVRRTRFLLYYRIGERIEDTWLSRSITNRNAVPDWRRVNTFSPGVHHSPHYRYHGAMQQIRKLEQLDSLLTFESAARTGIAESVLALWRDGGTDSAADDYIQEVSETVFGIREARQVQTLSVRAIPAPYPEAAPADANFN